MQMFACVNTQNFTRFITDSRFTNFPLAWKRPSIHASKTRELIIHHENTKNVMVVKESIITWYNRSTSMPWFCQVKQHLYIENFFKNNGYSNNRLLRSIHSACMPAKQHAFTIALKRNHAGILVYMSGAVHIMLALFCPLGLHYNYIKIKALDAYSGGWNSSSVRIILMVLRLPIIIIMRYR